MSEVTIVCCYNKEKVYNDFVSTLKTQTCEYDLIGIDNRGNKKFTSCAAAYNSAIDDVKTKYVIYSHQDILLDDTEALAKFVDYLKKTNNDDIVGVAGVRTDIDTTLTKIRRIDPATKKLIPEGKPTTDEDMTECETLDECFFGGHTEHFRNYPFDEGVCNGWHLYAVEACLRTRFMHNTVNGERGRVYVCYVDLIHNSIDGVNFAFYCQCFKLCRKYAHCCPRVKTTCTDARTDMLHRYVRIVHAAILALKDSIVHKIAGR